MLTSRHLIHSVNISSHHGYIDRPNSLSDCIYLSESNPDIDMFEIDFITYGQAVLSAHDYDDSNILKGQYLSDWFDYFIPKNKVLWIDLKDTVGSLIISSESQFDCNLFFDKLESERQKFRKQNIDLRDRIIISSQFPHIQNQLRRNAHYQIIFDYPSISTYLLKEHSIFHPIIQYNIKSQIDQLAPQSVIALDASFFANTKELRSFIKDIDPKIIIIYSLHYDGIFDQSIQDKHIIIQHDYFYPLSEREITEDLFPKN